MFSVTRDEVIGRFGLVGDVIDRLDRYVALVGAWQARLNLVGPATLPDIWGRHVADSLQLGGLGGGGRVWMDMGAGGGFPGVVLGIALDVERVVLVESIAKKCAFLREAVAATGARCEVANARVEALPPLRPDVITARALASLDKLFGWGLRHARRDTAWVLPKGMRHAEEIHAAQQEYDFAYKIVPSMTDAQARVVVAHGVTRR